MNGRHRHPAAMLAAALLLGCAPLFALTTSDLAVQVSATVQKAPPKITLSWPAASDATAYSISRKAPDATGWGSATALGTATSYEDTDVAVGEVYEYRVQKTGTATAYGYALCAIERPLVEDRGRVLLVVEDTHAAALGSELARLEQDLAGDGWTVTRIGCNRGDAMPDVKAKIKAAYDADPAGVKCIFLFGRVPVPYSGNSAWDGHSNHTGAWPADVFYGEMDGTWTDASVNTTTPSRDENDNVPGDGKYDQSYLPSDAEAAVGRVDLFNMPAFTGKTEADLLRQYLDKDHAFRHKAFAAQARGLIDDNFGVFGNEAFAASGWRSFAPMFGAGGVQALDFFGTLATDSYLWSYGCGGGSYTSASGVGTTADFASTPVNAVFTMLFGSYHGDWDVANSFLRAPLANAGTSLTCAWSGRPHWFFHHMALGEAIGFSTLCSQNNSGLLYAGGGFGFRGCHMALMGDPTLRMSIVAPVAGLSASQTGVRVNLSWTAGPDAVLGYHVYRAASPGGPFTRLTGSLVNATAYTDFAPPAGTQHYMVRAVRLESTASGSYYNASQGVFAGIDVQANTAPEIVSGPTATPNPAAAGETVAFGVVAGDADGDPLALTWTYGDGDADTLGQHAYAQPGRYRASVSASDGVDAASAELDVWIWTAMQVRKFRASVKFNQTGRDRLSVSGVVPGLPAGFAPEGLDAAIDCGGMRETFALDAKGRAKSEAGTFRLKLPFKKNKATGELEFPGGDVRFTLQLKRGTFAPAWADEGVDPNADAKNLPLAMTADLYLDGSVYRAPVDAAYSAKAGKSGTLKTRKP